MNFIPCYPDKELIRSRFLTCLGNTLLTQVIFLPYTLAAPSGGSIVDGTGTITQSQPITTINQSSQRLAIDWASFNVNRNEMVNFNQPDQTSIALNRINDINPSQIHGQINANGQIILANPNGILFGKTSSVNAGGLFAAALAVDPQEFMQGKLDFKALENTSGLIVNQGRLEVIDGGTLALLGQQVKNEGLLVANFGTVALAAGDDISVRFYENDTLSIQISQNLLAEILRLDDPQILNSGLIKAHGGNVVLTANQASAIKTSIIKRDEDRVFSFTHGTIVEKDGEIILAGPGGDISNIGDIDVSSDGNAGQIIFDARNINHSGRIKADSLVNGTGGTVTLESSEATLLTDNSTISTQSLKQGQSGKVKILGNHVAMIDSASIDASGANSGGEVLIGGDYQGNNPAMKNAEAVYLGDNTQIDANATVDGDGGKIIVWSDKATRAYGSLNARGKGESGKGGFIETSSQKFIDLATSVNVSAENGINGDWLIDPSNLIIGTLSGGIRRTGSLFESTSSQSYLTVDTLTTNLSSGANITVQTALIPGTCAPTPCTPPADISSAEPTGGNITLASDLDLDSMTGTGSRSLTLRAHHDIIINGAIGELTNNDGDQSLNLTLQADWNNSAGGVVTVNGDIDLVGGDLTVRSSSNGFTNNATISAGTMNISANTISSSGELHTSGTTNLAATSTINLNNPLNDFAGTVTVNNGTTVTLADANNLTVAIANNRISSISTNTSGHSTITDIDPAGTVLAAMTVGGNLDITSAGGISDSGNIIVNGTSTFRAPAGSNITLDSLGNRFNSTVNFIATGAPGNLNNLTFYNDAVTGFNLQNGLTVDGDLNLRSRMLTVNNFNLGSTSTLSLTATAGDIIQTNAISHAGDTLLSASGNIFDGAIANNLANVQVTNATTANINNGTNAIVLNGVSGTTDLNVTATGGISETGVINVSGTTTLDAGTNNIALNSNAHELNDVQISNANAVQINDNNDIQIAGTMNSLEIHSGIAAVGSTIANVTDSPLTVNGDSTFVLANGGSLNLSNFTGAGANNLADTGTINVSASFASLDNVDITNTDTIRLATMDTVNSNLLSTNGDITNAAGASITVSGDTVLQAENGTISLLNTNDFNNLSLNDSGVVLINDTAGDINITANNTNASNTIDLTATATGIIDIEGELLNANLTTTSGNIQSSNALMVENNTSVATSTTGSVDFASNPVDLETLDINLADTVLIDDIDNINITSVNANLLDINATDTVSVNGNTGTLNITTDNTISLSGNAGNVTATTTAGGIGNSASGLNVSGTLTLDAAASDINLTEPANDFNSVVITNAQNASLRDRNAINLENISVTDLTITSAGNISQSAGTYIHASGNASFNSGSASTLLGEANQLNSVSLSGASATLVNDGSLQVNDSSLSDSLNVTTLNGNLSINRLNAANTIQLAAADAILDSNGDTDNLIANKAILNASSGIGMNSVINTQLAHLEAHNSSSGDINIRNTGGDITLDNITSGATDTGNFNFESSNDVYINRIALQQNLVEEFYDQGTGTVNMRTAEGSFLGVGEEDINTPDITATNLRLIGVKGTLGSIERPVVLDISGKVELLMRASLDPIYAPPAPAPEDIQDDSIFQFTSGSVLAAVNGVQVTEVETLLDISPAIFTDIRHFIADENPLMLPRDQWFDGGYTNDDDDEYFLRIEGKVEQPLIIN